MKSQQSLDIIDKNQLTGQAAIAATPVSIVTLEPAFKGGKVLENFTIKFANPAFAKLLNGSGEKYIGEHNHYCRKLLKQSDLRSCLLRALRENTTQAISIQYQRQEQSLVLQISITPVDGDLVLTLIDITSLSHAREMLELQTTLMEENARSLEAVRSALEAEIKRRGRLESKLRRLAGTDHLSGLANRRAFLEKATAEFRRSRRYQHPLSLVMLDLDRFKVVNDTHGHAAGDCVIVAVSQICQSLSRDGVDIVGRLGGEEFAILLPETNLKGAGNFAERLRLMIENTPIYCDVSKLAITASLGVATLEDQDRDFSMLLNRSDTALYLSKETGRNMVSSQ